MGGVDALEDDLTPVETIRVTMEEREQLEGIINVVLDAIARETGKARAELSLELEQVVTKATFAAHRLGQRPKRSSSGVLDAVKKGEEPTE